MGDLATVLIISTLHPVFLLLFLGLAVLESVLQGKIKKKNFDASLKQVPLENRLMYLNDVVANFEYGKELRINAMGDWIGEKLKSHLKPLMGFYGEIAKNNDCMSFLSALVMFIQQGSIYAYLMYQILLGHMGVGDFTMYLAALTTFTATLQNLTASLVDVKQYGAYYTYLEEYLNTSCMGEKIAIVGENGAGKTTLTKLVTRLYEADAGCITIDGENINQVNYDALMKLFAVVYQDFKLFSFTLKENIALAGSDEAGDEDILRYIEQFGLSPRVKTLKQGIHTSVYKNFDEEGRRRKLHCAGLHLRMRILSF